MLAQGQSSSAERGGLAVVSSGLNFLKKKKKGTVRLMLETEKATALMSVVLKYEF